jgi:ATP-dependent DNA ligase
LLVARLSLETIQGLEGIVSKRLGSRYRSGRSPDWRKFKNPAAPAVKREAEEEWGR